MKPSEAPKIKKALLVGSTGLVGQNLLASYDFDTAVHSTNVSEAFIDEYSLVVYAGVTGMKYLANRFPENDLQVIDSALENLQQIKAEKIVLISTIDVYEHPFEKDEDDPVDDMQASPYGRHRAFLEQAVRNEYPHALFVRLPAIYGNGLKKNFVYDMIHASPSRLEAWRYQEFAEESSLIKENYIEAENGFYALRNDAPLESLDAWFSNSSFNALSFTDSRSTYQFYDLNCLWNHIRQALARDLRVLNIATPPISAGEAYQFIFDDNWTNHLTNQVVHYNIKSKHSPNEYGASGYYQSKEEELIRLKRFITTQMTTSS